jgi:hypothetical protein
LLIAEGRHARQLKVDSLSSEPLDHLREIRAPEGDMVDASRCPAHIIIAFHQVYNGVRARVQPMAARFERRTPTLAKPHDFAVELPEARDVRG